MRNRLKNINFFLTSIAVGSSIDNLVDSGTFIVKDVTVNGFSLTNGAQVFFVIVDADQTLKREIFRITNVNTATKTFTFDKRYSPNGKQAHAENALTQINDLAEIFNYIAATIDDAGATEVTTGRNVKVNGGIFIYDSTTTSINDATLTMDANDTSYIILDFTDDTIKSVTTLPAGQYYLFATAVTNGTDVLSLTDNRGTFVGFDSAVITPDITVGTTTTLAAGSSATVTNVGTALEPILNFGIPRGNTGSMGEAPVGEEQEVVDNIVPAGTSTVTTNNTTYVRVTRADTSYTDYNLTGIREYDTAGNLLTVRLSTGVFGANSIVYADIGGSVHKTTGIFSFVGALAYKDNTNVFTESNVFEKDVAFKGLALFPYKVWGDDVFLFDATYGSKQKFSISSGGALESHTLSFNGLRSGGNYVFAVVVSGNSISMAKATSFTDCDTITTMYTVGSTTYPLTLAVGTHLFVAEAFSTAIHVSYIGTSVAA